MPQLIQTFEDDSTVAFDRGSFDDWCVYLHRPPARRYAPTDEQYFARLQVLGGAYGHETIYDDFLKIYAQTTTQPDAAVLGSILRESQKYAAHALEVAIWLTVIYAGMIAEENKTGAILKKRIKRLGMHQALVERLSPALAATFSKDRKWRELDAICREKGF